MCLPVEHHKRWVQLLQNWPPSPPPETQSGTEPLDRDIPEDNWRVSFRRAAANVYREVMVDDVMSLAAQMSFYFSLALFPFLIFLAALVGTLPYTGLWENVLQWMTLYLPHEARSFFFNTVMNLTYGHKGFVSLGLVGATWATMSGLMNFMFALDVAYDVPETRSFWKRLGICFVMLLVVAFFFLGTFSLLTLGDRAQLWLTERLGLGAWFVYLWSIGRPVVALVLLWLGISLLDQVLPNARRHWNWRAPGTLFTVLMISPLTLLSNVYVQHLASYDKTYGALGAFMILMVWIYLLSLLTLIGAEINCEVWKLQSPRAA